MGTRTLLAAVLLVLLPTAPSGLAQTPARIGLVGNGTAAANAPALAAFRAGMRENGFVEGSQYVIEARYADGDYERFPELMRELLQRNPSVILVSTIASVRAAQRATGTVPIVMWAVNDPVGNGLVASLARPGGNTTGLSTQAEDTIAKDLELLREALPNARRVAVLVNPSNPSNLKMFETIRAMAGGFGIECVSIEAATPAALDSAFAAIAKRRPDALMILRDGMFIGQHVRISAFALKNRIPAFAPTSEFVDAGSLIAYAPSIPDMIRRSASIVRKILDGAKPSDIPIEQPTKFYLTINMKTAGSLGIKLPQSLPRRADRLIE